MNPAELRTILVDVFRHEAIPQSAVADVADYYRAVLDYVIHAHTRNGDKPFVLGICGAQGSGKSTMALGVRELLRKGYGLSVATLSLDDLYLSGAERARLARGIHPLLKTRGVPGTHDVERGLDVIRRLLSASPHDITHIPHFDKATDEPSSPDQWDSFHGRADIVIFEGWCVGARPQDERALAAPINALERTDDADGRWRHYVNEQLATHYQALFRYIDILLMLRAPGFETVFTWRKLQEQKLAAKAKATNGPSSHIMDEQTLERFIMHYERLTRHMLAEMPSRANIVLSLNTNQRPASISTTDEMRRPFLGEGL